MTAAPIPRQQAPAPTGPWHTAPPEAVCAALDVDPAVGLTSAQVAERRARYGPNALAQERKERPWQAFLRQYRDLMQLVLVGAAVVAASVATAAVGPVAFVALAAPQIARGLLRTAGEPLIGSAVVGAILVVGADVAARTLFPVDLPVGIVTAGAGGPFLLYLLVRMNRKATLT